VVEGGFGIIHSPQASTIALLFLNLVTQEFLVLLVSFPFHCPLIVSDFLILHGQLVSKLLALLHHFKPVRAFTPLIHVNLALHEIVVRLQICSAVIMETFSHFLSLLEGILN
jgi:hypothetical protein